MAKVVNIDEKIASALGVEAKQLLINGLAVSPLSRASYLAVARGKAPDAPAVIVRVGRDGKVSELSMKNVKFAKADLPNPPAMGTKPHRGHHRPGLCQGPRHHRRPEQRGGRLDTARHPLPLRRRRQGREHRDLPRGAR